MDLSSVGDIAVGEVRIRAKMPPLPYWVVGWVRVTESEHPMDQQLAAWVEFDVHGAEIDDAFRAAGARFREIALALRLSKRGRISIPDEGFLYLNVEGRLERLGREMLRLPSAATPDPCHVVSEDLDIVGTTLADITALHPFSDPYFEVACDRFEQSYGRTSPVDRFIDLIVALEALISEPEAIGYKVALRSALLAKQTVEERRTVRDLIKGAYDRRSRVLHGEKADRRWLENNLEGIEGVVRDVLRRLLSLRRSGESVDAANLDDLLILSQGAQGGRS